MHVIDFTDGGEVRAMHNDKLPLGFLGDQRIARASDIQFDEVEQAWSVLMITPRGLQPLRPGLLFSSYEAARRFEVQALNACRLAQVDCLAAEGQRVVEAEWSAIS